jgi:hypothetical protein
MLRIIPKVGPFRAVAFKAPTQETQRMFELSFNRTLEQYRSLMRRLPAQKIALKDVNLVTGETVTPGNYVLADKAYGKLVQKLAARDFAEVPEAMRQDILAFYSRTGERAASRKQLDDWQKTMSAVNRLRASH